MTSLGTPIRMRWNRSGDREASSTAVKMEGQFPPVLLSLGSGARVLRAELFKILTLASLMIVLSLVIRGYILGL